MNNNPGNNDTAAKDVALQAILLRNNEGGMLAGVIFLFCLIFSLLSVTAVAEEAPRYSENGTADCLECHDETSEKPVLSIFHTAHGVTGDEESPLGKRGCESCHGPSAAHVDRPRTEAAVNFGPEWVSPAAERTEACLSCHQDTERMHWANSSHELEDLSCNDCHKTHVQRDPILDRQQQTAQCLDCHIEERSKVNLPSRHPIKEGQTACTDCHNPHGSSTLADLREPSLNETCVSCHKEKRGPFIFEHAPVAEDCSECHQPHGSAQPSLLVSRPPFLCQQCHMSAFHPSQLTNGTGLPTGTAANRNLLGKSCLNCHSKVHGTNHPSGARLTR